MDSTSDNSTEIARSPSDEDTDEESEDDNSEEFTDLEDEDLICSKYVEPPKHKVLPQAVVIGSRKGGTRKVSLKIVFFLLNN